MKWASFSIFAENRDPCHPHHPLNAVTPAGGDKGGEGDWGGGAPSPPSITPVLSSYFSYHSL